MAEKTAEEIEQERVAAEEKNNGKIKFDAAQTLFVNELFNKAHGLGAGKAQAEYQAKLEAERAEYEKKLADQKAALEAQLAEALKAAKTPKTEEPEVKVPEVKIEEHPIFKQMLAQMDEFKGVLGTVKAERDTLKAEHDKAREERIKSRKKDQFLGALAKAKVSFFDPLEAYEIAEKEGLEYDADKDSVFVKNPATGVAKLNDNGEPMDAVDFVKDFATRKKYLVKAGDQEGGIGSTAAEQLAREKAAKDKEKDWTKATPEEFEAERQKILSQRR
jgi:hypothetical protein